MDRDRDMDVLFAQGPHPDNAISELMKKVKIAISKGWKVVGAVQILPPGSNHQYFAYVTVVSE